jgi:hypothetical protein
MEELTRAQAFAWAKALESNKYKQGTGALHLIASDKYCCLGVLNCVLGKEPSDTSVYSRNLYTALGVKSQKMYKLNDVDGKSFVEIAAFIRNQLKERYKEIRKERKLNG